MVAPGGSAAIDILRLVERAPVSKLDAVVDMMALVATTRKSSRILATHMMLDVLDKKVERDLILVSALYLEHLADRWVEIESSGRDARNLYGQIQCMADAGAIPDELAGNLHAVRRLRNQLSHELFYDVADWDARVAPFLAPHEVKRPKRRSWLRQRNLVLFKLLMMRILEQFSEAFEWLSLEDVPPAYRRRSNHSLNPDASLRELRLASG